MHQQQKATALILAASRRGPADSVAKIQSLSHKCLVVIDGMVMLERVVREIKGAQHIGRIYVSIESEDVLDSVPALKKMREDGEIHFLPSANNLFDSIKDAAARIENPWPLLVSTGDNALHTSEMIDHFGSEIFQEQLDAAVAMTPASVILEAYPEGKRAFLQMKDGGWSSCNLYALMNEKALISARVFEGGGQFGKHPNRLLAAFGIWFSLLYKFKWATIHQLAGILSRRWHLGLKIVRMPFADAPIDVDNPGDFKRTETILKARRVAG